MHSIPVRCCTASRFALVLLLMLGASGCPKQPKYAKKTKAVPCDTTVNVDAMVGARPQAVYLCEDDTLTWNPGGHQFVVEFKNDSPFEPPEKRFDNGHPSGKAKHYYGELTVYEYRITVDTTHVFDPQVVGGGNP